MRYMRYREYKDMRYNRIFVWWCIINFNWIYNRYV